MSQVLEQLSFPEKFKTFVMLGHDAARQGTELRNAERCRATPSPIQNKSITISACVLISCFGDGYVMLPEKLALLPCLLVSEAGQ